MKELDFVGGTSGSGKSTLLRQFSSMSNHTFMSTGNLMHSVVNDLFLMEIDKDKIKYLNWQLFEPYVVCNIAGLLKYQKDGVVVVDSHYAVHWNGEFLPAFCEGTRSYLGKVLRDQMYEKAKFVLVESDACQVYHRIINDSARQRASAIDLDFIVAEMDANRKYFERFVTDIGKFVPTEQYILHNHDFDAAIKEMKEIVMGDDK